MSKNKKQESLPNDVHYNIGLNVLKNRKKWSNIVKIVIWASINVIWRFLTILYMITGTTILIATIMYNGTQKAYKTFS